MLARPGAVEADPPDSGVASHYGDPFVEQRRLEAGEGLVDLSHRPVVRVAGPDRLTWLHSLTTQHLERLAPGEGTTALVLSPHGHVEHHLALVDDGEAVWAHLEPGTAEGLVRFLTTMRFWSQVEVEDVTDRFAVVWEPVAEPRPPHTTRVEPPSRDGSPFGRDVLVPRDELPAYAEGRPLAGTWALEALRIAAARPRLGLETDHRTIPHELDWLREAVHLDKGCYRGQETVARVHNLGRPPRRLVLLHLDGSVEHLPATGDDVVLDGRAVGRVTSAARHHELGPVALAVVKRNVPVDAPLLAGGVSAAQEVVVPA
ncbi:folate-binding protein [Vallicoccus soli]|uniref:Folate-binding protein n=1 Tax=Vallicoccus soli TaxID=2339232 RepID=A0A3A3ZND5_9ACTN|nr:folate-binding protein [Vallicoccus soli]